MQTSSTIPIELPSMPSTLLVDASNSDARPIGKAVALGWQKSENHVLLVSILGVTMVLLSLKDIDIKQLQS